MNGCEHYQELISRMIDGELSEEEKTELKAHLDSCEDCATLYKIFENLSNTIQEDVVDPPDEFCEEIMARLRREDIRRKNFAPWKKLIAAAACLAVILLAGAAIYPTLPNRVSALTATPAIQKFTAADSATESTAAGSVVVMDAPDAPSEDEASAQSTEKAAQKSAAEQAKSGTTSAGEAAAKSQESAGTVKESPAAAPQESAAPATEGRTVEILIPQDEPESTDDYAYEAAGETETAPAEDAAAEADFAAAEIESYAMFGEEDALMLAAAAPPVSVELSNYKRWTQLGVLLGVEEDKTDADVKDAVNAKAQGDAKVEIDAKNKVNVKNRAAAKDEVVGKDEDKVKDKAEFDLDGVFPDAVYELSCLKHKDLKMTVYVYGEKLYYRIETVEDKDTAAAEKAAVPSHEPVASPDVEEEEEAEEPLILAKCNPTDFVKFIEAK